jgi:adenylate cyclase
VTIRTVTFFIIFAFFFKKAHGAKAMVEETTKFIKIDLNQFKLHLYLKQEAELTLHFDSPSRRFYLSVIALVVHEMKIRGKITSIPLQEQLDILALLNKTVGASAGSSKEEHLLPRVYRKWKDALPDLENAPLFKVVGRKKRYDESMDKVYGFDEGEKDSWANLFEYKGSHDHVRLRFSIDRLDASLDDAIIVYGESPAESANEDAWDGFIAHLKKNLEDRSIPERAKGELKAAELPLGRQRRWLRAAPGRWLRPVLFALIALVGGAAILAAWKVNLFAPQVKVASVEKMAFPLPDKPSIAVLPFRNLSDDPKQEYFSDGLTDDLITDLSKISQLFVISRNSVFTYKDTSVKISQVAEELGVRYVLEGSVRRAANQVRINAQLIDATTGGHLWAERYDGMMDNIFVLQDKITQKIVAALKVTLTAAEEKQAANRETSDPAAYDAYLKGWAHYRRKTPEDLIKAVPYLDEAVERAPNYSRAYAALAAVYWVGARSLWGKYLDMSGAEAEMMAKIYLAEAMQNPTPLAHWIASDIHRSFRRHQDAITEATRAIALDSNDPIGYYAMSSALIWAGNPVDGAEFIKKAMRLDPHYPPNYLFAMGKAQFFMGRYDEAAATLEEIKRRYPDYVWTFFFLAATYGHLGREQEAKSAIKTFYDRMAKSKLRFIQSLQFINTFPFKEPHDAERLREGLRIAGVPERPSG